MERLDLSPAYTHPWRLVFMLPATLLLRARIGVHHPSLAGCLLHVKQAGLVEIGGPCREAVFDQTARFLRVLRKGMDLPPTSIDARSSCSLGRDSWQIVIGADIAFMPGGIEPHMPRRMHDQHGNFTPRARDNPRIASDNLLSFDNTQSRK
jgi:hypothetical protein